MATQHVVRTTHIQRLIRNGLGLAETCNGRQPGQRLSGFGHGYPEGFEPLPEHALQKAAADLRHAAEELEAERLSCLGWPQV